MIEFLIIFAVAIIALLTVQALDVECAEPRSPRRVKGLAARKPSYSLVNSAIN